MIEFHSPDCFIATGTGAVIASIIAGGAAAANAKIQSDAARRASQQQIAATTAATAAATKGNEESLAFQQQQADRAYDTDEVNRHGTYDQWAAREGRLSTIGGMLGMPAREIPGYVPLPARGGSGSSGQPSAALMPAQGEVDWSAAPNVLQGQLAAFFTKRGAPTSEVPYWVGKAQELVARGQELKDPLYASKRLAAADIFGGGQASGGSPMGQAQSFMPGSIRAMGYATPAYQAPKFAPPGSVRAMAGV